MVADPADGAATALDLGAPRLRADEPREHFQKRGLSSAVRAEHREGLPSIESEGDAVEGVDGRGAEGVG